MVVEVFICVYSLPFCSIVGATIISIGLYVVLWGKALEEIEEDVGTLESPSTENAPLLQSYRTDQTFEKKTDRNVKKHGHQIEIQS
jgi:hypothetical protein